jgi:hypothetical protein
MYFALNNRAMLCLLENGFLFLKRGLILLFFVNNAIQNGYRKTGQRGKVVNGKLVKEKKAQKCLVFAYNKKFQI